MRYSAGRQVEGLAAGKDGRVYLLVETAGDRSGSALVLDRFDPSVPAVERIHLDGLAVRAIRSAF